MVRNVCETAASLQETQAVDCVTASSAFGIHAPCSDQRQDLPSAHRLSTAHTVHTQLPEQLCTLVS